jgi:DNA-binding GntR family transcriptional regulator
MSLEGLEKALEKSHSIYYILENELSIAIDYGIAKLRPVKMNAQSLKQMGLDLPAGSVMLYLEQVDYDRNRQPVAVSYEYHVSDFCEFKVYRRR